MTTLCLAESCKGNKQELLNHIKDIHNNFASLIFKLESIMFLILGLHYKETSERMPHLRKIRYKRIL